MTAKQALKISNQNNIYYTSLSKAERIAAEEILAQVRMSARGGYMGFTLSKWSDNNIFERTSKDIIDYLKDLGYKVDNTTDPREIYIGWSKPTK